METEPSGRSVLTLTEAATLMRVCTKTIARWIADGKVPAARAGRHWRIRRRDVDGLFKRQGAAS